ncbi:hypothetical protein E2C01_038407 [Portunus trituberculatus]|uniref:Uncharacterized protein n=1 Tax=Portunus trituberculatus TaxID=210409 RepID=A0A5B7FIG5_PORTR|nr:hypothetical protein [Portunus trituberculatus]
MTGTHSPLVSPPRLLFTYISFISYPVITNASKVPHSVFKGDGARLAGRGQVWKGKGVEQVPGKWRKG